MGQGARLRLADSPVLPPPAQRLEEIDRGVEPRLPRADIGQLCIVCRPLRLEHVEETDIAGIVTGLGKTQRFFGNLPALLLGPFGFRVFAEIDERIIDVLKR